MSYVISPSDSVFVAGEWVKASATPEPVINPATEEVLGLAPVGARAEIDAAIGAAREAFDRGPWPRMTGAQRADVLTRLFDGLMARKSDIQRLITEEVGAVGAILPIQFDFGMILAKNALECGARNRDQPLLPGAVSGERGASLVGGVIRREPVGVV